MGLNTYSYEYYVSTRGMQKFDINYQNVYNLAAMSYNVYTSHDKWYDVGFDKYIDASLDNDTVQAFLFSSDDSKINVIAIKGTSIYWSTTQSTVYNDKYNDNMFFSCCYYKESNMFDNNVCKCEKNASDCSILRPFTSKYCYKRCYENTTTFDQNYLNIGKKLVDSVKGMIDFENTQVIFTGHSLGGVVATMLGVLEDKYVVTFESPGEKHYLKLIGMKYQEMEDKVYHFGHNADVIFTGKCNGRLSWCYLGGYVMYTKCHIGNICEYDSIRELNMKESIFTHKIKYVINNVIKKWNGKLPKCVKDETCEDCEEWEYI